jgi:uncharacterized membrane protein YGL010W
MVYAFHHEWQEQVHVPSHRVCVPFVHSSVIVVEERIVEVASSFTLNMMIATRTELTSEEGIAEACPKVRE